MNQSVTMKSKRVGYVSQPENEEGIIGIVFTENINSWSGSTSFGSKTQLLLPKDDIEKIFNVTIDDGLVLKPHEMICRTCSNPALYNQKEDEYYCPICR